jgi:hypothetical protein
LTGAVLRQAVESLLEHGRPGNAISLLRMAIHCEKEVGTETLFAPLESLLQLNGGMAQQEAKSAGVYDIAEVIRVLQDRDDADTTRLSRIEWNFLGVLDGHHGRVPKTLHRRLCDSPAFFVELLSLLYRSRNESSSDETTTLPDDVRAANIRQGFRLLHDWRLIPGTRDDGAIDEERFRVWCDEARRRAIECGRIEMCDSHFGQLFAHSPNDADGTWPCTAVRQMIESVATESMASGLCCGILNSRGAVCRGPGGDQERELAARYERQASQIRFDSPFTAEVLDDVARSYDGQAGEWDELERWNER